MLNTARLLFFESGMPWLFPLLGFICRKQLVGCLPQLPGKVADVLPKTWLHCRKGYLYGQADKTSSIFHDIKLVDP